MHLSFLQQIMCTKYDDFDSNFDSQQFKKQMYLLLHVNRTHKINPFFMIQINIFKGQGVTIFCVITNIPGQGQSLYTCTSNIHLPGHKLGKLKATDL